MKSSFIKSLPSHRRKEKERKQRLQRQRRSYGGTRSDEGGCCHMTTGANQNDYLSLPDSIHNNRRITSENIKSLSEFPSSAILEGECKSTMNFDETQNQSPAKKFRTKPTCQSNIDDHKWEQIGSPPEFAALPVPSTPSIPQTLLGNKSPSKSMYEDEDNVPLTQPNDIFLPGFKDGSIGMINDRDQLKWKNCKGKLKRNSFSTTVNSGAHCQLKSKCNRSDNIGSDQNDGDDSVVEGTELPTSCLPILGGTFTQDRCHALISNRRLNSSLQDDPAIVHETQLGAIDQVVSSSAQDRINATCGPIGTVSTPNLTRKEITNYSSVQSSIKSLGAYESPSVNNENMQSQPCPTPRKSKHRLKDCTGTSASQTVDLLNLQFIPLTNREVIGIEKTVTNKARQKNEDVCVNNNNEESDRKTQDSSTTFRRRKKNLSQKQLTEFTLSSTDLADIIEEVKETAALGKSEDSDNANDPELENFLSSLESFHQYLIAISISSSMEARELETKLDGNDKVFAIFRCGLHMDHCNVIFYLDAINYACDRMTQVDVHSRTNDSRKIYRLSSLVKWIFEVDEVEDSRRIQSFTVDVTKEEGNQTSLLFQAKPLETCNNSSREKGMNLPEHLVGMLKIFEDFAAQSKQKMQSQLNTTRQDLARIRMGAFELQRLAVQLRDHIAQAKNEAQEARVECVRLQDTIRRQEYEFQRRKESFDRVKEHYKAEIIGMKQEIALINRRYEQRLKSTKEVERANFQRRNCITLSEPGSTLKITCDGSRHSPSFPINLMREPSNACRGGRGTNEKTSLEQQVPKPSPIAATKDLGLIEQVPHKSVQPETLSSTVSHIRNGSAIRLRTTQEHHSEEGFKITSDQQGGESLRDPLKQISANIIPTRLHNSRKSQADTKAKNTKKRGVQDVYCDPIEQENSKDDCKDVKDEKSLSKNLDANLAKQECPTSTKHGIDNSKDGAFSNVKNSYETKNHRKTSEESDLGTYKYKEVVRGHDRRSLPGRECEHCRLFHDAMCAQNCGDFFDREKMVNECSRHRSRYEQDLTPPDFWEMSFADSIANRKPNDAEFSPVSD
ncbi:hypothetical protein ACHAXS_012858 [Conticribra weissflogii]